MPSINWIKIFLKKFLDVYLIEMFS